MNLTIDREVLLDNLNVISRGLPLKSPMPILTGIKLYATDVDLFLTSSNSDISVEVRINDESLNITEAGSTVIPGKYFIDMHWLNTKLTSSTFSVFHLDISGKDSKDWQLETILEIFVKFEVFHFDISGKDSIKIKFLNKFSMC